MNATERRLRRALRKIDALDCSFGMWPRETAKEIAREALERERLAKKSEALAIHEREAYRKELAAQSASVASDTAKDAARYRWLRDRLSGRAYRDAGVIYSEGGIGIDAAIDAALSSGSERKGP